MLLAQQKLIRQNVRAGLPGAVSHKMIVDSVEGFYGYSQVAGLLPLLEAKDVCLIYGGFRNPVDLVTDTKDNTSTISNTAAGLVFQTQSSPGDNDDITRRSLVTFVPVVGKVIQCRARLKIADVANLGMTFGFGTSTTAEYYTAEPADGIWLHKAKNAATVVGKVCANAAASVASATLETMVDDTYVKFGITAHVGTDADVIHRTDLAIDSVSDTKVTSSGTPFTAADVGKRLLILGGASFTKGIYTITAFTTTGAKATLDTAAGSTSASSGTCAMVNDLGNTWGYFWSGTGTDLVAADRVAFTEIQKVALADMVLTSAPTFVGMLGFRLNSTAQKSATVDWAIFE